MLAGLTLAILAVAAASFLLWSYGTGSVSDRNRLEAIKTAATIVLGAGGAAALWLAARRQRTSEISLKQKELDQEQARQTHALQERTAKETRRHQSRMASIAESDALERRIIELYTKAVDQLGSNSRPVRLGGLYALERLAQENDVPRLRQTVVNVICAYLRMPFPPPDQSRELADEERARWREEQLVRLAAQRMLTTHLSFGLEQHKRVSEAENFWPRISLDMSGAVLIDFDFSHTQIEKGDFESTMFSGRTRFDGAEMSYASFRGARFLKPTAFFYGARFKFGAAFNNTEFEGEADFSQAIFGAECLGNPGTLRWDGPSLVIVGLADLLPNSIEIRIGNSLDFSRAAFADTVSFTGTVETTRHPDFDDAVFARDSTQLLDFAGPINGQKDQQ